ncbi:hypothetical protein ACFY12_25755 [Streptomyces sp. NPDC001339]|uniref:hypothetical protein n=1 Tax=Streptomyces sp. NPDC001339 TaxID=3364563 RepID=UPI0036838BC0
MTSEAPPPPALSGCPTSQDLGSYLAGLGPTVRNVTSAALAVARIDELGWAPRGGYPGSDVLWPVACLMCGWSGTRFYSHLRRARPAMRHRGCVPQSEHPRLLAALSAYAAGACACRRAHPTTPADVAEALGAMQRAVCTDDHDQVLDRIRALTGPCPATLIRAQAVRAVTGASK